jgi:pSer/pThr/pTyr-binding forkhead associated (FHA) protein
MDEQTLNTFRYVVGAARPIRLAVRGPEGGPPGEVVVDSPYAVIGRSGGCHVCLNGDGVSYRHAYLQVIGGRILCVDLLSATGVHWDGGEQGTWLSPEHRLQIGGYTLQLFDDGWTCDASLPSPLDVRPRNDQRPEYGVLPEVELELTGGAAPGKSWPINRVLTLVGRDERCRITCADDRISKVHCSLLLAPSGLWVVDLLGRGGVLVNGERLPCAYLPDQAELQVGKYQLRVHYPQAMRPTHVDWGGPAVNQAASSAAFLTRHHQVFPVSIAGDTLIVSPQGDIREFFYQDIHLESNKVVHLLQAHPFQQVLVDFSQVSLVGSVILDAVATFCRTARGGAAMCAASPELLSVLETMNFPSIWPYYPTQEEALRALHAQRMGVPQA